MLTDQRAIPAASDGSGGLAHQVIHKLKAVEFSHVTYIRGISSVKSLPYHFASCKLKNEVKELPLFDVS